MINKHYIFDQISWEKDKFRLIGWYFNHKHLSDFKGKNLSLFSY